MPVCFRIGNLSVALNRARDGIQRSECLGYRTHAAFDQDCRHLVQGAHHWGGQLTTRNHDPEEVHHEVVAPEIISLRPTVGQVLVIVIKHRRSVVQHVAVDLAQRNNDLEWMAQRVRDNDEVDHHK